MIEMSTNPAYPILAALLGFAGTMVAINTRAKMRSNPTITTGAARGMPEPSDTARYDYLEIYNEAVQRVWEGARDAGPDDRYPWSPVPLRRIQKIWSQYARDGEVIDDKGLDAIARDFVEKIATIDAMTDLAGHSEQSPRDVIGDDYDPETEEKISDYIIDEQGHWRITDSALNNGLRPLAMLLLETDDAEAKLQILDRILSVVHPRSDISSWFVQGGRASLDVLFAE